MVKAIQFFLSLLILSIILTSCSQDPYSHSKVQSYLEFVFTKDVNGQIDIFSVEKNDERKAFYYLLLSPEERSDFEYFSEDNRIREIDNYYSAKFNLRNGSDSIFIKYPLEYLDFGNPIDFIIGLIHLDNQNISQDNLLSHLSRIEKFIDFEKNDNISVWSSLEFLKKKMELFYNLGRNDEAIICASFARHIISKQSYVMQKYIPEIEYRYLMNFAEIDDVKKSNDFDVQYKTLTKKTDTPLLLKMISLDILNLENSDSIRFNHLLSQGEVLLKNNKLSSYYHDYFNKSVCVYYLKNGLFDKSIFYISKSLNSYKDLNCAQTKSVGYIYLAINHILKKELDKAKHYLDLAFPNEDCAVVTRMRMKQYYYTRSASLCEARYTLDPKKIYLINELSYLKKLRSLQEKIFTDKYDLHGYDAFATNTEGQLNSYLKLNLNDSSIIDIVYLFEDSKLRNLKIEKMEDAIGNSITGFRKLDRLNASIEELNSVLKNVDYSDSRYKDLYVYNKEKQSLISELLPQTDDFKIEKKNIIDNIDFIKNSTNGHLEILNTPNNYWFYYLDKNQFILDSLSKNDVDQLVDTIRELVFKQKSASKEINKLKKYFDFETSYQSTLSISTDGSFNYMPLSLLFENDIYKSFGNQTNNDKNHYLNKSDFSIYSFTNEKTNRRISNMLDYPELLSAYKSCVKIQENLGVEKSNFISGDDFTKNQILDIEHSKAWHISTHAVSSTDSHFDNFFVARTKEGKTDSVFAYDILKIRNTPKFLAFSACNTGVGDSKIGAGDFSLSRPFHEIGTNTILTTLWEVKDDVTAEFFNIFYNEWLIDGISVLSAFSKAKEAIKQKYPAPYHWAPFVLEGNPNVYLSE